MKILNTCNTDPAGATIALTEAINETTPHEARHICRTPHKFGYAYDIITCDPEVVKKWVKWADIVNTHNRFSMLELGGERLYPKILVITYHGSYYRLSPKRTSDKAAKRWGVAKRLCSTPDLTKAGAVWLPIAVPVDRYQKLRQYYWQRDKDLPIVCQAPSDPQRKSTRHIKRLLGNRRDISLRIRYNCPHDEALRRIAQCDIYVDEFHLGLGVSGLEACAMGVPVICWADAEDEACILREVGYLPYYKAALDELPNAVSELLGQPKVYKEYATRSLEYVRTFHDYPKAAERYIRICEEVRG